VSNDVTLTAKLRARWPNGPIGRRALSHVLVYALEPESLLEILRRIRLAKKYVSLKQRNARALNISRSLLPIGRFAWQTKPTGVELARDIGRWDVTTWKIIWSIQRKGDNYRFSHDMWYNYCVT